MLATETALDQKRHHEEADNVKRPRGLSRALRRVAILGAGTMGARVAAHFANAGVPSLLLDIVVPNQPNRNAAAQKGLETAVKQKPAAFFVDDSARLVKTGNFEDNLKEIADCDWIMEAVTENLQIKRDLWRRVEEFAKADAIRSTNTSGIPLYKIAEGFPEHFRRNFLGTHFFNPPRYLHLLEVIPGPETDPEVMAFVEEYGDKRLGKGVVVCKDTPNFVANRIGCFFGATASKICMEDGYTIEEVDALTGPLIGLPSTASFRMLDLVGLDVWASIGPNLHAAIPDDPWRERFLIPDYQKNMVENKWLGEKTGQGFYKKVVKGEEKEIWAIDWKTLEYHPAQKPKFASVEAVKPIEDLGERLQALLRSDDRAGKFLWKLISDYFIYAAEKVPEISNRIVEIDRAMRWGYGHKLGPFELWDALGFQNVVKRLQKDGRKLPANIQEMVDRGANSLYRYAEEKGRARTEYFDFVKKSYQAVEPRPRS